MVAFGIPPRPQGFNSECCPDFALKSRESRTLNKGDPAGFLFGSSYIYKDNPLMVTHHLSQSSKFQNILPLAYSFFIHFVSNQSVALLLFVDKDRTGRNVLIMYLLRARCT